jgi:hypothetical protein
MMDKNFGNNTEILWFGGISELKKKFSIFLKLKINSFSFPFLQKYPSFI